MVRIEVETIVWSSAASSMPAISPIRIVRICAWVRPMAGSASRIVVVAGEAEASDMKLRF